MSYIELTATVLGIWATILSARRITYTWLVNLVGVCLFAAIFYQAGLYADLVLQAYYFTMGILGWLWWNRKAENHHVHVKYWSPGIPVYLFTLACIAVAVFLLGYAVDHFHTWMPQWFPQPATMPYINSIITVISITGTYMMGRRWIENWWLWAFSNPLAAVIYWQNGMALVSLVFMVFWIIGLTGWYNWEREYKSDK